MIWEPFAMALVLGLLMSAGLYFAYLWPSVEPDEDEEPASAKDTEAAKAARPAEAGAKPEASEADADSAKPDAAKPETADAGKDEIADDQVGGTEKA